MLCLLIAGLVLSATSVASAQAEEGGRAERARVSQAPTQAQAQEGPVPDTRERNTQPEQDNRGGPRNADHQSLAHPTDAGGSGSLPTGQDAAQRAINPMTQELATFTDRVQRVIDNPSAESVLQLVIPLAISLGRSLLLLVVLALVAGMVSKWLGAIVKKGLKRTSLEDNLRVFAVHLVRYGVWILAIPIAFAAIGIEATSIAALLAALGVAVGLGLQGALSNIAAGLMLLLLKPIRVGDLVVLQGKTGRVRDIGLFLTVVNTFEDEVVSIPNSDVFSDKMENLTGNPCRRIDLEVGVAYGTDLEKATEVIREALSGVESRYKEKDPNVWLKEWGDSSINFEAQVYCPSDAFFPVRHEAILRVNKAIEEAGIEIPFPQRTLHGSVAVRGRDSDREEPADDSKNTEAAREEQGPESQQNEPSERNGSDGETES